MRNWWRATIALLGAALCLSSAAAADEAATTPAAVPGDAACAGTPVVTDTPAEADVLRMVNGARVRAGLPRLRGNAPLAAYALRHSQLMARDDSFAHSMVDGRLPFAPRTKAAGETLAVVGTPWQAVSGWLGSPHHRAALLSPDFRLTGVGAVRTCSGSLVITQEFLSA